MHVYYTVHSSDSTQAINTIYTAELTSRKQIWVLYEIEKLSVYI